MMRHVAANALTLLILGLVVLFGAVTWVKSQYHSPGPLTAPLDFEVDRGEAMTSVADKLAKAGAISNASIFRVAARYANLDEGLKFGEYSIPAGASMQDILGLLNKGGNVVRQIVVPEGLTSFQVVELLKAREELTGDVAEVPPEGSLAPAGYDFQRGDARADVLARMQAKQEEILATAWAGRADGLPLRSPEELLTLASIVEKETGVPEERARVAEVFVNRLKKGMKLQTDPSVIYGLTKGEGALGRGIRASELATATPYNTYMITGLPPTPIANPGRAAIEASANPTVGDDLYFVADGSGGHAFASTLEGHNQNVAAWRRLEAQKAAEAAQAAAQPADGDRGATAGGDTGPPPSGVEGTPGEIQGPMARPGG